MPQLESKSSQQSSRGLSHLLDWTGVAVSNKYLISPQQSTRPQTFMNQQVPWLQHNTSTAKPWSQCLHGCPLSALHTPPPFMRQQRAQGRHWHWQTPLSMALPITGPSPAPDLPRFPSVWKQRSDCDSLVLLDSPPKAGDSSLRSLKTTADVKNCTEA